MTNPLDDDGPVAHKVHRGDAVATKAAHKADDLHKPSQETDDQPAGGFDDTPVPRAPPGWTVKITFHRAKNLPFADFNTLSSDPYILAQLNTKQPSRHKQDPKLRFRTPTIRKNTEPEWECDWIVANVPSSGFELKARVYDEDPADHDDRLGNVHVHVHRLAEDWQGISERHYTIRKRMGSKRAYFFRGAAALIKKDVHMNAELVVSVQVLGRTPGDNGGRVYTLGPCYWRQHYSPLFGRLVGTKDPASVGPDGKNKERYNFQANQIQLRGPTPDDMYHRYVEFKPFIKGMFTATSLRGRILNRALHHQHSRIYNFDRTTVTGRIEEPCEDMTRQFLDLAHWDKGGRLFTYVITLDGQMRFTETGKEFGIDMLSKHTMHADCDNWISFSGEFFIRRLKKPWTGPRRGTHSRSKSGMSNVSGRSTGSYAPESNSPLPSPSPEDSSHSKANSNSEADAGGDPERLGPGQASHPPDDIEGGPPNAPPPKDPRYYQLIIDNDSGTYRPNAALLPQLRRYLMAQFPGLRVSTLDCQADADRMARMKNEQRERKKKEGKHIAYVQIDESDEDSESSLSSSDEEELDRRAGDEYGHGGKQRGKVGSVLHRIAEPKDAIMDWAQGADESDKKGEREGKIRRGWREHEERKDGKHERERREEEDDQDLDRRSQHEKERTRRPSAGAQHPHADRPSESRRSNGSGTNGAASNAPQDPNAQHQNLSSSNGTELAHRSKPSQPPPSQRQQTPNQAYHQLPAQQHFSTTTTTTTTTSTHVNGMAV